MPLSWNEIKDRALRFSREWADEASEDAEAKSFWDGFFEVFGVPRRCIVTVEHKMKNSGDRYDSISSCRVLCCKSAWSPAAQNWAV
jgi:hypothetical protein